MKLTKKGAALMQILLITVVLAGVASMLLRASLSRTMSARRTRRAVTGQMLIKQCMDEVNSLVSSMSPEAMYKHFNRYTTNSERPFLRCRNDQVNTAESCHPADRIYEHVCVIDNPYAVTDSDDGKYKVTASFVRDNGIWKLQYEITQGSDLL